MKASHFVDGLPSARLAATSFGGFSALAVTAVTCESRLPGRPLGAVPLRLPWMGLPFASSSTVVVAGCGSVASNEDAKSPGAGAGAATAGVAVTTEPMRTSAPRPATRRRLRRADRELTAR